METNWGHNTEKLLRDYLRKLVDKIKGRLASSKGVVVINSGRNNKIIIKDRSCFSNSRIEIKGNNNRVYLSKSNSFENLQIKLTGDSKSIFIDEGEESSIVNLRIISEQGSNQCVDIGKSFSCLGLDIYINGDNEACKIGSYCSFANGITIFTSNQFITTKVDSRNSTSHNSGVTILDKVWCCEDVKFLSGSSVQKDSIVGSGAVVTDIFNQTNILIVGYPAKPARFNVRWDSSS